eukprot:366531-Chlamydomonas_euryale.AAC.11
MDFLGRFARMCRSCRQRMKKAGVLLCGGVACALGIAPPHIILTEEDQEGKCAFVWRCGMCVEDRPPACRPAGRGSRRQVCFCLEVWHVRGGPPPRTSSCRQRMKKAGVLLCGGVACAWGTASLTSSCWKRMKKAGVFLCGGVACAWGSAHPHVVLPEEDKEGKDKAEHRQQQVEKEPLHVVHNQLQRVNERVRILVGWLVGGLLANGFWEGGEGKQGERDCVLGVRLQESWDAQGIVGRARNRGMRHASLTSTDGY